AVALARDARLARFPARRDVRVTRLGEPLADLLRDVLGARAVDAPRAVDLAVIGGLLERDDLLALDLRQRGLGVGDLARLRRPRQRGMIRIARRGRWWPRGLAGQARAVAHERLGAGLRRRGRRLRLLLVLAARERTREKRR